MNTYQQPNTMLTSVPNSLRDQLERAQNLLSQSEYAESQGDHSVAIVKAREGMQVLRTLAASCPELATMLMAADMGHRGFELEMTERTDSYQLVERKFFGMSFGYDAINTPTMTRRTIRARVI